MWCFSFSNQWKTSAFCKKNNEALNSWDQAQRVLKYRATEKHGSGKEFSKFINKNCKCFDFKFPFTK
jgi:hypothetical protein